MLHSQDYNRIRDILYSLTGISLGEQKEIMVFNRVRRMMKSIGVEQNSISEILTRVEKGEFTNEFINAFTTNKTHFFREQFHFEDFKNRVLSNLAPSEKIKIFSSASSTGEEPYSIAMSALATRERLNKNFYFDIVATDIDTEVLSFAKNGIYEQKEHSMEFPSWIKPSDFFKRRVVENSEKTFFKVKDEVKSSVKFQKLNLMSANYPFKESEFDVIFCRNVLIYFSNEDQNRILKNLFRYLKVGGTLYLGHSENPLDLAKYTKRLGHNIFLKMENF